MLSQRNRETGSYDLAPASIGRRRLKNRALGYLMQLDDADAFDLCLGQFAADHNMVDGQQVIYRTGAGNTPIGRLTDGQGRTVDFTNAVLIMTSNLGAREAASRTGFRQEDHDRRTVFVDAAERW